MDPQHRLQRRPGPPALRRGPGEGGVTTGWVEDLAVDGEALGRPRSGLTSRIHLAVDGRGLPMSVILTPGQAGDDPQLLPLLDQTAVGRDRPGRPRTHPDRVLADKAYSHPSTRAALRSRGIGFTSPERIDRIAHRRAKGSRGGRPPAFDPDLHTKRDVVERCFNRLRQFRALATRYAERGGLLPSGDRHRSDRAVTASRLAGHAPDTIPGADFNDLLLDPHGRWIAAVRRDGTEIRRLAGTGPTPTVPTNSSVTPPP